MWYLYLDESGDLGFDFKNKHPSKYFTITILCFQGTETNHKFGYAVKKTLARKLKHRKTVEELKGVNTTLAVKKYLYQQIQPLDFSVFAVTLDKKEMLRYAHEDKERLYNYAAKLVIDKIPVENINGTKIEFIIDKSKNKTEVTRFDKYIRQNLQARIAPNIKLFIAHENSKKQKGLQIADLFCWGIFQKYENNKTDWFNIFKEKIIYAEKCSL